MIFAPGLRAEPATHALPLVFLYDDDDASLRNAALNVGADDYFALTTPPAEINARLEALFWRAAVGRRAAPVVGDQRSEIDNFVALLDSVNADVSGGAAGTLALVEAVARDNESLDTAERNRMLAEARGFLKLNLRRIDAVAFYGPTTLLVYLPRLAANQTRAALTRLRDEFIETRPHSDIAIGCASFPARSGDTESLVEHAVVNLKRARAAGTSSRIVSSEAAATVIT